MKTNFGLIACLILLLTACSTIKKTPHNTVDDKINNISWSVISFKGKMLDAKDFASGLPILIFSMQDGKISGNDGCNNFMGVATYNGNSIATGAIATTRMACPGNTIQNDFYDFLASKNLSWRLDNNAILRLYVNDAEVMALKERE